MNSSGDSFTVGMMSAISFVVCEAGGGVGFEGETEVTSLRSGGVSSCEPSSSDELLLSSCCVVESTGEDGTPILMALAIIRFKSGVLISSQNWLVKEESVDSLPAMRLAVFTLLTSGVVATEVLWWCVGGGRFNNNFRIDDFPVPGAPDSDNFEYLHRIRPSFSALWSKPV